MGKDRAQQENTQQAQIILLTNENRKQAAVATWPLVSNEMSLTEEQADSDGSSGRVDNQASSDTDDGSPSGFPSPPKFAKKEVIRSPRLAKKQKALT